MWRYLLFSLLLILSGAPPLAADASLPAAPPRFITDDADGGLPNAVVTSLAEDRSGFLWVGNARGAARFDGQRYRQYGNRWSVPSDETSVFVRALLAARDGTLWVGTDFAGLAHYDPLQDQLVPVTFGMSLPAIYSASALADDDTGRLWIGTDGQGLLVWDPDGSVRQWQRADNQGLPDDRINRLLIDRAGTLWVGTWDGLVSLPTGESELRGTGHAVLDHLSVTALFEAEDGQLWVGGNDGQLWRLSTADRTAQMVTDEVGASTVHTFLQIDADTLWVGCDDGIEIRSTHDGTLHRHLRHQPGNPHSLAANEVRTLLRDRGGQIWVGGYGGGLQRHNPLNAAFRLLDRHAFADAAPAFDNPNVRSIVVLDDERILLGTQDRGILVLDAQLQAQDVLRDALGQPLLRDVRVTGLAQTIDGAVWIGSDAGLFRRDTDGVDLKHFELEHGRVRRLLADPQGGLWIATEDGLSWSRPGAAALERKHNEDGHPLRRSVNAMGFDSKHRLWVGGEFGLGVLTDPGGDVRLVDASHPARGDIFDVIGLWVDDIDTVWFDTPSGLFRLHPDSEGEGRVEAISALYGAAGQPFGANLMMDAQKRLWSQDHLLDQKAGRLITLGPADGAVLGSPWFRAFAQMPDGRLLFGGTQGLLVVEPQSYQSPHYDAPLVITSLHIDGASVTPASMQNGLQLHPGQRRLEIEFAALDYSASDELHYAYRLVGESPVWIQSDASHRVATFANLAPGTYRFELRSSDRFGRVGNNTLSLPLIVQPAWWQLWWVRLAALLLLVGAVLALMQQRTKWLRAHQHRLEKSVATRTRELQDMAAALREKSRALEVVSLTDPLTGLRNRRHFSERIDADAKEVVRQRDAERAKGLPATNIGLVFFLFDIDHFKQINDHYGHAAGDAVLKQVADCLRTCFRQSDDLVRWGGEEFLVVARGLSPRQAEALAERAVRGIAEHTYVLPDQRVLRRTCSLGYASYPLQAKYPRQVRWADVVELADRAMYVAKRAGRNGWVGIEGGEDEPLPPDLLQNLAAEFDAGRLRVHSSLPLDAVRQALATGNGS